MKNPKEFKATPWSHSGKIDKSGPSKELVHNATRPWSGATPMSHFKPTKHSGSEGIGNPSGVNKAEMKSSMAMPAANKGPYHKGIGNPKEPTKWHKRGYTIGMDD
jgi:hypothetical protein